MSVTTGVGGCVGDSGCVLLVGGTLGGVVFGLLPVFGRASGEEVISGTPGGAALTVSCRFSTFLGCRTSSRAATRGWVSVNTLLVGRGM